MQILVTGGTGFIGKALVPALVEAGHEVLILSRGVHADRDHVRYLGDLDSLPDTASIDAIINLAGASLAMEMLYVLAADASDLATMHDAETKAIG